MAKHFKLKATLLAAALSFGAFNLQAQTSFDCSNLAYQTVSDATTTTLYSYNINTGTRATVRTLPYPVNAAAYSPLNNLIYASRSGTNTIVGMGASGPLVTLTVTGLEAGNIGDITPDGYMLIANSTVGNDNRYFFVDVNESRTATYGKLVDPTSATYPYPAKTAAPYYTSFAGGATINVSDMAYNPIDGLYYGLNNPTTNTGSADVTNRYKLVTLDPKTGQLTFGGVVSGAGIQTEGSAYGSVFFDASTTMYVFANNLGRYYSINRSTRVATQIGPDVAPNGANDGASCPNAVLYNVSITGTVFSDANGMTDNTVNGTGTNAGGLSVVLWDAVENKVLDIVAVQPDGTYSLAATPGKTYNVIITTQPGVVGSTTQPPVVLPAGWGVTGQKLGSGTGSDGTPSGILSNIAVGTTDIATANFGINQTPQSENLTKPVTGAPVPNQDITFGDSPLFGNDPEDQPGSGSWSNRTIAITSLPTNGFSLFYDGVEITAADLGTTGFRIPNFDPSKLATRLTTPTAGVNGTSFTFATVDATGVQDPTPATVAINFSQALPVIFGTVEAFFSGETLTVNWEALKEINNSHYDVELSADGVHFTKIGTTPTQAPNGSSDETLNYSFSGSVNGIALGAGLFAMLMGGLLSKRKRIMAALLIGLGCTGILYSCSKNAGDSLGDNEGKYFVRVAQVDKDGTTSYSKTVTVIKK
jgi:hypothetical protein